jgi:hypothetical protein
MDFLASPAVVTALISLTLIGITALLRDKFGETRSEQLIKLGQAAMHTAELITQAAEIAVTEVEHDLKQSGEMSNEELKEAAVHITVDLLANWGVQVDEGLIRVVFSVVESAYQRMKAAGA